jgi:hypothetical protein
MSKYNEQLQGLFRRYQEEVGITSLTSLKDVGLWAINKGLWEPRRADMLRQFSEEMARALREEFYTDPQGRRVRTKHAVRIPPATAGGEQQSLWGDIRSMSRKDMETSAQQRRHGIVADCLHLKTDVDSFNDNRSPDNRIQVSFDFRADLAELEVERRQPVTSTR